ncbi:MAG: hypothetical protein B6242_08035 [Anaerolineaceae bacterium 4572_78]|nr:MAG: hypothetical protein B6242_08035 [Anaerolineaceae bacterium 4572_78]
MNTSKPQPENDSVEFNDSLAGILFRLLALAIIDAFALWFIYHGVSDGGIGLFLATAMFIITLGVNAAFLREELYPLRWLSPGLALMILLVVYPVLFTAYTAFTNYGTGHLLVKEQALEQIAKIQYLPKEGVVYSWTGYRSDAGDFAIWVMPEEGKPLLLKAGQTLSPDDSSVGSLDNDGIPESIAGYERLTRAESVRHITEISEFEFGEPPDVISVKSLNEAAPLKQRYIYNEGTDTIEDKQTNKIFKPIVGTFTADDGEVIRPGYYVITGIENFRKLFTSPAFRGPFIRIFIWTGVHAFFTVLLTFSLGVFFAIVFDDPTLPGRKLIRSLLLIPYAIPAFITVQMWRGLLNPQLGVISQAITAVFGSSPDFFSNQWWAKIGILFVQLWLGFPYMMLICTGALQSIPSDLYEAANVDGANVFQQFWNITLPLLLVAVGPLLVGSFAFNFNNFTVIDVYNQGGPPIPNSPTPAGHTDILISYTFRLAFAGGRGIDYGYASAITIVIFLVLSVIVLWQYRFTEGLEETM